jgi:hypothetical protein
MKRLCRLALFLCCLPVAALGQTGLYVDFSAAKPNVAPRNWLYGPTFGAYFDHGHLIFLSTGLDLRGSDLSSGNSSLVSGLVGPRLVLRPHILPVMPYVEALAGAGHASYGPPTARIDGTKFEYQFLGGIDLTVLPRIDWRVIEFSYGGLSGLNTSFNPKTFSTGIVVRIPFL